MVLASAALSAILNLLLLAVIPFLLYTGYHKWRHKRSFEEIKQRAGLQIGEVRYLGYSVAISLVAIAVLVLWPPPVAPFIREGAAQQPFAGLGLTGQAIGMALLYGVVKTGFSEEFLFRGLIGGSLSRRLPDLWANLAQSFIFLLPHLLILLTMREIWFILPIVFIGALVKGWLRMKSGSILGPWLIHASVNTTVCLSIAARTAS